MSRDAHCVEGFFICQSKERLLNRAIASPKQIPTKVGASPIFRLFLGTDLQRFYNGLTTALKRRRSELEAKDKRT